MTPQGNGTEALLARLLQRLDELLPPTPAFDGSALAYRWRRRSALGLQTGWLEPVHELAAIDASDLLGIDRQRDELLRNTHQFVRGLPANNALLTGARGTGKSSLVRACLLRHAADGLRLIEVDRDGLADLPAIAALVRSRPERYLVFCDDLSFETGDASYKALKAALDGSIAGGASRLLIYATSNRRHLMPEFQRENLEAVHDEDGELHPAESSEEKISLSERFGLWIPFHSFRQDEYLRIVAHWLGRLGLDDAACEAARTAALQFALQRGSRSGRVAQQFARDWAGRHAIGSAARP